MKNKTKTEYRVVCASYGTPRHGQHAKTKTTLAKAKLAAQDANDHAAMLDERGGRHWQIDEAPYRVQTREVGAWADYEDVAP